MATKIRRRDMGTTEESRMKELIEDLQKQVTALKVLLEVERGFHKQQWKELTEEEFQLIYDMGRTPAGMMEMVESRLREKNGYGS
jgi:hypothetical protein